MQSLLGSEEGGARPTPHLAETSLLRATPPLDALAGGGEPAVGFLLGARRVAFHASCYRAGQVLEVSARHLRGRVGLGGLAFACALHDAAGGDSGPLAEGNLNVVLPDDLGPWQNPGVDGNGSGERRE